MKLINFYDYALAASCTLKRKKTDGDNIGHFGFGVVTEFFELDRALKNYDKVNLSEECGDSMWYLANHALYHFSDDKEFFKNLTRDIWHAQYTLLPPKTVFLDYQKYVEEYGDIAKKYFLTNKRISGYDKKVKDLISKMIRCLASIQLYLDIRPAQTLSNNINKLKDRYGSKFDDYLCFNRDLIKEYSALKSGIDE